MKVSLKNFFAIALLGLSFGPGLPASAQDAAKPQSEAAQIVVTQPWTRATVRGASVGVGYLTIENKGAAPDRLVGAATDEAAKIELHETQIKDGVMTMRPLTDGLEIKPGAKISFKPGSYHLMMLGLKGPLLPGGSLHAVLTFEKAGAIPVDMPIEALGATSPTSGAGVAADKMAPMDHMHH